MSFNNKLKFIHEKDDSHAGPSRPASGRRTPSSSSSRHISWRAVLAKPFGLTINKVAAGALSGAYVVKASTMPTVADMRFSLNEPAMEANSVWINNAGFSKSLDQLEISRPMQEALMACPENVTKAIMGLSLLYFCMSIDIKDNLAAQWPIMDHPYWVVIGNTLNGMPAWKANLGLNTECYDPSFEHDSDEVSSDVSDSFSVDSSASMGTSLQTIIEALKQNPKFVKKGKMVITQRTITKLENALHEVMVSSSTSQSPTDLIKMAEELAALRKRALEAETEVKAAKASIAARNGDISALREALAASESVAQRKNSELMAESAKLAEQLKAAKAANTESKKLVKSVNSATVISEDEYNAAVSKQKEAAAEVTRLNNALAEINKESAQMAARNLELKNKLQSLEAAKKAAEEKAKLAKPKSFAEVASEGVISKKPIENKTVKKLFGDKGLEWLSAAEQAVKEDIRERAYNLMLAAKSSTDKKVRSLHELLAIVFQWCKMHARKLHRKIAKWVDMVEADMRSGMLKSIAYYRQELEKVIGEIKQERANLEAQKPESSNAIKEAQAWARVLTHRTKRGAKRVYKSVTPVSWFKSVLSSLKRVVPGKRAKNFFASFWARLTNMFG